MRSAIALGEEEEVVMKDGYMLVLVTCPDRDTARALVRLLVERKLVACGQLLDIESIYTWEGKVCEEPEVLLILKSTAELFEHLQAAIVEHHPYEVPQIVQLPITGGLPAYLGWMDELLDAG